MAAWKAIQARIELIRKSFTVTGIAGSKADLRNDVVMQSAMANAEEQLKVLFRDYDNFDDDFDPFASLDSDTEVSD